jgi:hypothetical protein
MRYSVPIQQARNSCRGACWRTDSLDAAGQEAGSGAAIPAALSLAHYAIATLRPEDRGSRGDSNTVARDGYELFGW